MNRRRWILIVGVAVLVGAGAAFGWRAHVRSAQVTASVPSRPDVSRLPVQFVDRLSAVEGNARRSGSVAALAELAVLYHANGFVPEASQCEQALMQLEPNEGKWPHRLATLRAGYGELDTAILLWEHTVRLDPDFLPPRIRLGDAYLKTNRDAEASAVYTEVLKRDASNPYALVGLARIDLKAGQAERARERLEKAAGQSNAAIGTDLLVTVYEQLGQNDRAAALRARTKSAGTYFDPPDPWIDGMMDDCYDVFRLSLAAGFAEHRGDRGASRRILERAYQLDPNDGHILLQLGMLARRTRDNAAARRYLERATEVAPKMPDPWAQLIELHTSLGDEAAAMRALSLGLINCPNSPGLHLERGRRLADAGQFDAAIVDFRETFRLRPDEADPLIKIAEIELRRDRTKEAVAELRRALDAEPEHPVALMTLALYTINIGDEPGAREWLRRSHLQLRVPRDVLGQLTAQYAQRFGRPYVMEQGGPGRKQ